MDPRGIGPVDVRLNGTLAQLLVRLTDEVGGGDPSAVLARALGLFEMAQRTRRGGGTLLFRTPDGREAEVVF
ncbi:MAG: hypothetical protein EXR73_08300 [Myxococcales bacterium]|nr:hypothetical protein [Myxococcales bacterium]